MNNRPNIDKRLTAVASAVALALGSVTAFANDDTVSDQDYPGQYNEQTETRTTESGSTTATYGQHGDTADSVATDDTNRSHTDESLAGLSDRQDLETFIKAVEQAGLTEALQDGTTYTVFAPTNEAFESMQDGELDQLMKPENVEELRKLVRSHIVADDVDADAAKEISQVKTLTGGTVALSSDDETLKIGDAKIVESDIEAGSLVVHTIDKVLTPADAEQVASSSMQQSSESSADEYSSTESDSTYQYEEEEAEEE